MKDEFIAELISRNLHHKDILPSNKIFELLEELLSIYNLNIKTENTANLILARFCGDKIQINCNRLIALCYLESQNTSLINKDKIDYINNRIMQVILHELQHVLQEQERDSLVDLCNERENYYKSLKNYNLREYLSNPLERMAEINSIDIILKSLSNDQIINIFIEKNYRVKLYGYYVDDYNYPLNYFFNVNVPKISNKYNNIIIGNDISYDEFKNEYNNYMKIRS